MAEQFPPMRTYPVDRSILRAEKARAEEGEMYSDQLQYSGPVPAESPEIPFEDQPIEQLGIMYSKATSEIEHMLERREKIRQVLYAKLQTASDMAGAISEQFNSRTGLNTVMRAEGIDHRERF